MKRTLILMPIFLLSYTLIGQTNGDANRSSEVEDSIVNNITYVIIVKKKSYALEFEQTGLVNPNHIEKIEVVKSGELLETYNSDGIILIYPKKEYRRKYKRMFKKKRITEPNIK
jgi:hypothetical protein